MPNRPTVLVVEDDADEWFLIRWAFCQHLPKTQVIWLANADDVIPYLEDRSRHEEELPKLITLDLYLPSSRQYIPTAQAGIRLIQTLKSHYLYRQIPLVTLSRSEHTDDIAEALKYSTNSYLVKPNDYSRWADVLAELHNVCPELKQGNEAIF